IWFVLLVLACLLPIMSVNAAEAPQSLEVVDPYLELHTGPGAGYPVFHVIERDKIIQVIKRRTDWFKVRTDRDKIGWIDRAQMAQTLTVSGERTQLKTLAADDYSARTWEAGIMGGDFKGSTVMTVYTGYYFTENFSTELSLSQILGGFSSSTLINVNVSLAPFPEWTVSPYFTLGTGVIETRARSTLVQSQDRSDNASHVGIGARMYFAKQFLLRFEYKDYVLYTSENDNKEIREWKIGFGVFF
ncbi:MAG: outer membrane beta-barrel protein, partial [Gammaproteobacteria bacterium]